MTKIITFENEKSHLCAAVIMRLKRDHISKYKPTSNQVLIYINIFKALRMGDQ